MSQPTGSSTLSLDIHTASTSSRPPPMTHSRDSSGNSDYPSPATPTFSLPEHSRHADLVSSLSSTPPDNSADPPALPVKTVLHDLVEDPSEREDGVPPTTGRFRSPSIINDESDFHTTWQPAVAAAPSDYDLSDGFYTDSESPSSPRKRRGSIEDTPSPVSNLKARISQRMPSLSRKLRDKRSFSNPMSFQGVRSAPASRAPSIRSPSGTRSIASPIELSDASAETLPIPIVPMQPVRSVPSELSLPTVEEPIDRAALASTPLLPPPMMRQHSQTESVQSPLQSPTVVDTPSVDFAPSASVTPMASTVQTPTLSTRGSTASFSASRASQLSNDWHASAEQLVEVEDDEWTDKLGHANFTIHPAPYTPLDCDVDACKRLTSDWELAKKRYLAHISRVSEDYGPTSLVFKLTEEKWATIDSAWKQRHDGTMRRAQAYGVDIESLPQLTERTALAKIPTIDGPEANGKTMTFSDNGEIVGPMVTYVSRIKPQSKKNAFLRFFQDLRISTS